MLTLNTIFSSPSRTSILRTLQYQTQPLALRHIAYLTQIPIYSIQRSLEQLHKQKFVTRRKHKKQVVFALNKNHKLYDFIKKIFTLEEKQMLSEKAQAHKKRAQAILKFTSNLQKTFHKKKFKKWTLKIF